ncbi:MAG TPA: HNH endonuclease signature motif containing protein [Actinomycetota bacterium]|nr:HNH endonuclease signature motif containing protein [Actinomycetota bacterium]
MVHELRRRDRHCRYPSCRSRKGLDVHHKVHWAHGGKNDPDNLVLLCEAHHIYVHEAGYKIRGSPPKVTIERPGREPLGVGPPRLDEATSDLFEYEVQGVL